MKAKRLDQMAAVVMALGLLLGACVNNDDDAGGGGDGGGESAEPAGAPESELRGIEDAGDDSVTEEDESSTAGGGFSGAMQLPAAHPSIIKTAQLDIEVARDGLQDAVDDAIAAAQDAGGFVLSTRLDDERSGRGTLVLRVPSEKFESALASLDDLGDVLGRSVSGEDVGEEFVDLEARLRNFEAQEAVLLRLMDRAETVSDTIKVQRELTGIQLEVERIRGRLRFLEDQTSLGTVTLKLSEPGAVVATASTLEKAWERAGGAALAFVSGLVISLGVVVPAAILLALAFVAFRLVRPRFTSTS
jgi:Domain of unknown function (DUF4349)